MTEQDSGQGRRDGGLPWLTAMNGRLSRYAMYIACACLASLLAVVVYGVVLRYGFDHAPPFVEQVALLLVISVAMFGASAGVRDAGHIGLDSAVRLLPIKAQFWCKALVHILSAVFALSLLVGGIEMAHSTEATTIPTLGISEAVRYVPVIAAGVLITLFSIEHLVAQWCGMEVVPSWN
jgi:TRAP-type C4-dicarboxylate transport system permease small subunit